MSFLYPTFLVALVVAVIPVIIHLFNFRKFKPLAFSNVRFLLEFRQASASRRQIREWLILAARVLTLVFLVLAFAQPYLSSGKNKEPAGRYDVAIYIDNSYSMGQVGREGALLDQARRKAEEITASYPPGTRFQLITNEFKGKHRHWMNKQAFIDQLAEIRIAPESRNIEEILLRMRAIFKENDHAGQRSYILSDFQQHFIPPSFSPGQDSLALSLVKLKQDRGRNVAIDSVGFLSPAHPAGGLEQLLIRLRNYSGEEVANVPLKLKVNGRQEAIGNLSVPPAGESLDTLVFRSGEAGWKQGELSITDYPITFDDRFYFTYRVAPPVNVLLIHDEEAENYLEALFEDDEQIRFSKNSREQIDYSLIAESDLVILQGLREIPSGLAAQLEALLARGRTLVLFPAAEGPLKGYNELLQRLQAGNYGPFVTQPNRVAGLNLETDIFKGVFEQLPQNPDLPRARAYFRLHHHSRTGYEALMSMQRDDMMARYRSGRGWVYLSAVALDEEHTNLPHHALFVPLMYKIALLSTGDYPLFYTIGKDQLVKTGAIPRQVEAELRIRKAAFEMIPQLRKGSGQTELFLADQLPEAGNYALTRGDDEPLAFFAFNHDPAESKLSYYRESALKKLGRQFQVAGAEELSQEQMAGIENFGVQLWKYCVVLALIFLLIEILLIHGLPRLKYNV